ncbi:MAG: hypothetical protein ACTSWG_03165 [Candidatus Helarchaeota archaeon]
MKKKSLIAYTTKNWDLLFTLYNTVNFCAVYQKTKQEAMARYDDGNLGKNIKKVKITIEEI